MNNEIKEVLEELQTVRPEMLNENAKRLFDAIMTIADERDKYAKENERLNNIIDEIGKMLLEGMDNNIPDGYTYFAYKTMYGHYLDIKNKLKGE